MNTDIAAEIAACLDSDPGGDCTTDEVKDWLFTAQNSVAVRLRRIIEADDKTARTLLTARAERTWVRVTDPKGKAQRLWARLSAEFLSLAKSKANSLQAKVEFAPKGMLASVFPPEGTGRQIAAQCYEWCQSPLAVKADLIFPLHAVFGQMPVDKAVWRWRKYVAGREYAVEIPPVGDFVAAMVMNRLAMMVSLAGCLGHLADDWAVLRPFVGQNKEIVLARDDWERDLDEELQAVRDDIYDTPDAQERAGALALLQVYLALENYQRRFAADWTVIPWPADADPENPVILIIDRPEQMDLDKLPTPMDHIYLFRGEALGAVFTHALKEQPGEVVSIVKGGLEWLREEVTTDLDERLSADPLGGYELPWIPDAPGDVSATTLLKTWGHYRLNSVQTVDLGMDKLRAFVLDPRNKVPHRRQYSKGGVPRRLRVNKRAFETRYLRHIKRSAKTEPTQEFIESVQQQASKPELSSYLCGDCGHTMEATDTPEKCAKCGRNTMEKL